MTSVRTTADIAALVRAGRATKGWSQEDAAAAAGVSRRFVSALESGRHPNAELWRALALMGAVGVDLVAAVPDSPRDLPAGVAPDAGADDFDLDRYLLRFAPSPDPGP